MPDCHKSAADYRRWRDPLHKKITLPRLVVTGDFYTERSIEGVSSIEIVDPRPKTPVRKMGGAQSPSFTIITGKDARGPVSDLASFARIELSAKQVGDGKGFHGLREFEGASLAAVFKKLGINPGLDSVIIASAPDGYRSLISAGELLLSPSGKNIILADRLAGKPIDKLGKFVVVVPDDLSADRWVRAVEKIEIVGFPEKASLSIIGVGCGDTALITLEAISAMAKADAFVCTADIGARFSKYMGGKPVLYDPLLNLAHYYRKMNPDVSQTEAEGGRAPRREHQNDQGDACLRQERRVPRVRRPDHLRLVDLLAVRTLQARGRAHRTGCERLQRRERHDRS